MLDPCVGGVRIYCEWNLLFRWEISFHLRPHPLPRQKGRSRACNLHDYTLGSRVDSPDKWTSSNLSIEQFLPMRTTFRDIITLPDFLYLPRSIAQLRVSSLSQFRFPFPPLYIVCIISDLFRSSIRACRGAVKEMT